MVVPDLVDKARTLNDAGRYTDVIAALPDNILEAHSNADLYTERALACWNLRDYDLVNKDVDKALSIKPDQVDALNLRGNFCLTKKDYAKAIDAYTKGIEIRPKYHVLYYNLGIVYAEQKIYDKAIYYYKEAINLNPNYVSAYYNLGIVYGELKKYQEAIPHYEKAIELDPYFTSAYHNLGFVHGALKNFEKSLEYYKKALELEPGKADKADIYLGIGFAYWGLKNHKKEIEYYLKALEVEPHFAKAYYNLGLAYTDRNEIENALDAYKNVLKFSTPGSDLYVSFAKSEIERLKKSLENPEYYNRIRALVSNIKSLLEFKEECVTHYTSLTTARALILEGSPFRLSEGTFLNDTSEGKELFRFLENQTNESGQNETPKKVVPLPTGVEAFAMTFAKRPFIGSFVDKSKQNNLNLWRTYGKEEREEATGCAITIKTKTLLENLKNEFTTDAAVGNTSPSVRKSEVEESTAGATVSNVSPSIRKPEIDEFKFYRVAYYWEKGDRIIVPDAEKEEDKEEEEKLNKYMVDLRNTMAAFNANKDSIENKDKVQVGIQELLNEIAYLFKSAEYQFEHEVRLIIKDMDVFNKVLKTPPRVYIELVTIKPLICGITLGPKVLKADEWASSFYYSLYKQSRDLEVKVSRLPFK